MPASPVELEAAYMIRAADAAAVGRAIAALPSLAGHALRHAGDQPIRDILFDTPGRALGARGFVLRIRRVASGDLLTLKGASRATAYGAVERMEIEGPWSAATLERIATTLAENSINLAAGVDATTADHVAAVQASGMDVIQDRETARDIYTLGDSEHELAELSLDVVTLRFGARIARFSQVEIESKSAAGADALPALTADLQARCGEWLRPWPYGKLASGKVLEQWSVEGRLDRLCDAAGDLTPDGVDAIETVLRVRATPR